MHHYRKNEVLRLPIAIRPGFKSRTVEHLANDLMLAQEIRPEPPPQKGKAKGDIEETPGRRGRAIFLVGAGCSQSAGIPLAKEIAERGVQILAERYLQGRATPEKFKDAKASLNALVKAGKLPARFRRADGDGDWEGLYPYIFSE